MNHEGGCHCGALRYCFEDGLGDCMHCHCSDCRRTTGGTVTTWITVTKEHFHWKVGKPAEYTTSTEWLGHLG